MSTGLRSAMAFVIGLVIFAGLPLLGWGITDLQGFMAHPARVGYVALVILLQGFVLLKFPGIGRTRGEGTKTVRRQRLAVLLLQVIPLATVIVAPYSDRRAIGVLGEYAIMRYLGLVLFALGFITMNWAEAALGKQFSIQVTLQEGHALVTDGPFRLLRHPRYLSIIVFNLGIALVFRSGIALLLVVALTVVLLWRIHDEEAFMRAAFGNEWEAYSRQSWRLIPFVY
jgi:protein-S-isoprenylcysteine O-methyltransferase Ste14